VSEGMFRGKPRSVCRTKDLGKVQEATKISPSSSLEGKREEGKSIWDAQKGERNDCFTRHNPPSRQEKVSLVIICREKEESLPKRVALLY